jgi:hypothetical protein
MKRLFTLAICGVLSACTSETEMGNADLIGKWKLVEALLDPGDGSGVFQPITSDRTIEFFRDGKFISSEPLCPGTDASTSLTGTYSVEKSELVPDGCSFFGDGRTILFKIEGRSLILSYPCIEACRYKYVPSESEKD